MSGQDIALCADISGSPLFEDRETQDYEYLERISTIYA